MATASACQYCQFSRLLAGELCTSACRVCTAHASLCSAVMWRLLVTHLILLFPLHFSPRASPCAITFQTQSTSGSLTSIETSKRTWLRQKLGCTLGSMKRGFFITKTSKRSSCSTIVSCYEGFNDQNPLSWYHGHSTQDIGLCNTTMWPPIVSGTLTRDASAVPTVNNGSIY